MAAEASETRCPHCRAGEPSVWDGVFDHYAHPAGGDKLKFCEDPWRERCRRCSGSPECTACTESHEELLWGDDQP